VLGALADLVLPRTCAGCGLPGAVLCRRCRALLAHPHPATPRRFPDGFPPAAAAGAYAGPVRSALIAFKERGRAELAQPLGTALALAVAAVVAAVPGPRRPVLLVPVPSTPAAVRTRGRDHVRELTSAAVAELRAAGVDAGAARLLRRRGRIRDSADLSVAQRRANLAGSFLVDLRGAAVAGRQLVVVDDVVTSGATLTEAAAALERAAPGGPVVVAAVVAATPKQSSGRSPAGTLRHAWEVVPRPPDRLSGRDARD